MKKGMILLLCLLVGCSAQTEEMPAEEKLKISEIFHKEGQLQDMYYTNLLENRLANVLKEEWQSLHIVMDKEDGSAAYDFIIDESDKINEIKQILSNTILTEEKEIEALKRAQQKNQARKPSAILEEIEGMFGAPDFTIE